MQNILQFPHEISSFERGYGFKIYLTCKECQTNQIWRDLGQFKKQEIVSRDSYLQNIIDKL